MLSRSKCKGAARAVVSLLIAARFVAVEAVYLVDTDENIKATAKSVAADLLTRYHGDEPGQNPGILPGPPADGLGPYYWWQGGAMMGTLIDYWHWTGDGTYNKLVMQGMLHQAGGSNDYMTENYTLSLGNDDQAFWGMSAMGAAETRFPNPPSDKPQWLALAQAVWATQADPSRHDDECGGGLHWQIPQSNIGYDYKNTIANGCFFNLGARLARYTANDTYAKWAEESWDWMWKVQYIDHDSWLVYDGGHTPHDCKDINKLTYSYNAGVLIQGLAFMYNYTKGEDKWKQRLDKLVDASIKQFFAKGALFEPNCEFKIGQCGTDMLTYKGFVHRWMAGATQMAPFLRDKVLPVLQKSAEKAVAQCTGGPQGKTCGFYWSSGQFQDPGVHNTDGAGEAMSVLAAVSGLLIDKAKAPVTNSTGGISKGTDGSGHSNNGEKKLKPVTTADRAGAWIITVLCFGVFIAGFFWVAMGGE